MPGSPRVTIEGLDELKRKLEGMDSKLQRRIERRVLRRAMKPMLDLAKLFAPVEEGDLVDSLKVQVKTRRGRVSAIMGPSRDRNIVDKDAAIKAIVQEFGSVKMPIPNSYMRPAWDQDHRAMLERLKAELKAAIEQAAGG